MRNSACNFRLQESGFRFPAEFELQEAVWISWPNRYEIAQRDDYLSQEQVSIELLEALAPHVRIKLVIETQDVLVKITKKLKNSNVNIDNIFFNILPYIDIWIRDWGPIYVINNQGEKRIVNFKFTSWGLPEYEPNYISKCDAFASIVAFKEGLPLIESKIVGEGGNWSSNGEGTIMTIESTELRRNPGWTKNQLEAEYKRILGAKKVIWLKHGVIEDNAPNEASLPGPYQKNNAYAIGAEHIDEVAHFADPSTVLLTWVTEEEAQKNPIAKMNQQRLKENYDRLIAATDHDGNSFKIVKVPIAETQYYPLKPMDDIYKWISMMDFLDGSSFPASNEPVFELVPTSYMNIVVSNYVVLVPKYWKKGMPDLVKKKDEQVGSIMKSSFPDRTIIRINPLAYNICGGGMHCAFQQEPAFQS